MAVFAYKARPAESANGRNRRGTISADSPRQARDLLRAQGLRVQDLSEMGSEQATTSAVARFSHRRGNDLKVTSLAQELSTLLSAGIPLLEGLEVIAAQHRGAFRASLQRLIEQIAAGVSLADAMRQQPGVFDELCVCLADVGERTGKLDEVLNQLATYRRRREQLTGRLGTALIYPIIVVTAGIGVAIFLSTFVVPRLLETLLEAGKPLPIMTQIVKAFSDLLLHYGGILALVIIALAIGTAAALRVQRVRRAWHAIQLRIPITGRLIQQQAIVRMAVTLAILTRSGMDFIQALALVGKSMPNLVLREALQRCEDAVIAGRDIGPALAATGAFPQSVVRLLEVGQATGRLDQMLERLAADYDQQVQTSTQRLVAALEPAMILLLAAMIGFIVLAVLLPYLEAGNVLS